MSYLCAIFVLIINCTTVYASYDKSGTELDVNSLPNEVLTTVFEFAVSKNDKKTLHAILLTSKRFNDIAKTIQPAFAKTLIENAIKDNDVEILKSIPIDSEIFVKVANLLEQKDIEKWFPLLEFEKADWLKNLGALNPVPIYYLLLNLLLKERTSNKFGVSEVLKDAIKNSPTSVISLAMSEHIPKTQEGQELVDSIVAAIDYVLPDIDISDLSPEELVRLGMRITNYYGVPALFPLGDVLTDAEMENIKLNTVVDKMRSENYTKTFQTFIDKLQMKKDDDLVGSYIKLLEWRKELLGYISKSESESKSKSKSIPKPDDYDAQDGDMKLELQEVVKLFTVERKRLFNDMLPVYLDAVESYSPERKRYDPNKR